MIFIDSNIPMYILGSPHTNKLRSLRLVERYLAVPFVTSVEVLQEILHRYHSIGKLHEGVQVYDYLVHLVDDVWDVTREDIGLAKEILLQATGMGSRDAVHAACMLNHHVFQIMTFDRGFRKLKSLTVLDK